MILLAAACGSDSGTTTTDASPTGNTEGTNQGVDAAPVPTTVTISGVVSEITTAGKKPISGATVAAYKVSDDSLLTMVTSGTDGTFSISEPTNGAPIEAYLVAKSGSLKDTYLYPPGPLSQDFMNVPVLMLSVGNQSLANQIAGADAPDASKGWIGAVVEDATLNPVAGATLTSTPTGQIHYNSSSGLPQAQAMSTAADGTGYVMNVPAGNVTIGAAKSGSTFHSHVIKARADKITLTLITP